jgi:hypothetical protein
MSAFLNPLRVELVEDSADGKWRVLEPFQYQSDIGQATFVVPANFETDFCSVPRIPLAYSILGNRARRAGVVHDFLYSAHPVDRETADEILREMVLLCGLGEVEAESFFLAVRFGGASHW